MVSVIGSSKRILVKNCGSKYENPKVVLYEGSPLSCLPLETTTSLSGLKPFPFSISVKLLGFTVQLIQMLLTELLHIVI